MANIRIDLDSTLINGQTLTFKSPADCSAVTGLKVYYPQQGNLYPQGSTTASKTFQFADAHGNNVGSKDLFAKNVLVKVIVDIEFNKAYVQNADTNAYLEAKFEEKAPKSHGNHVPDTQTAKNNTFLRNDNTWQTVTPANIGAVPASGGKMTGAITLKGIYLTEGVDYGTSFPTDVAKGKLFLKKVVKQ